MASMLSRAVNNGLVLASRRRPGRARPRRRARRDLPDWAWGLALGLGAVLIVGGIFLAARGGLGGGASGCNKSLPPLGTSDISARGFLEEDIALARLIELVDRGAIEDAESEFFGGGFHNFVHNVDGPIRENNEELGKEMCEALIELEEDFASHASSFETSLDAQRLRDLLREAAQVLGYPPP